MDGYPRSDVAKLANRSAKPSIGRNQTKENKMYAFNLASISSGASGISLLCFVVIGILFYFLPTLVGRNKKNIVAIFMMNLLLGWSFIGWVIALIWACTKD
jgi:hypothetical protein